MANLSTEVSEECQRKTSGPPGLQEVLCLNLVDLHNFFPALSFFYIKSYNHFRFWPATTSTDIVKIFFLVIPNNSGKVRNIKATRTLL